MPRRTAAVVRALAWLSGAASLAFVAWLLVAPVAWIEGVWVRGWWPWWASLTSRLHSATGLPLTIVVLSAITAIVVATALSRPPRFRRMSVWLLGWVVVLAASFVPAWGATYRRAPLAHALGLPAHAASVTVLVRAFDRLALHVHAAAPERALAATMDGEAFGDAVAAAARCVSEADALVSGRGVAVPTRVTQLPAGTLLRAGYGGIALPWLLEPHVDRGLPSAARLAVATHELVHAAGWAREADTDALALLAGIGCDDERVRYANALAGLQAVASTLVRLVGTDGTVRQRVDAGLAGLPAAARDDRAALAAAAAHWYRPAIARSVSTAYDAYLRSQGVEDGVADYDASGALLAAALAECGAAQAEPWCR